MADYTGGINDVTALEDAFFALVGQIANGEAIRIASNGKHFSVCDYRDVVLFSIEFKRRNKVGERKIIGASP
jgi:hypothetical protein